MGFVSGLFNTGNGNGWQAQGTPIDKPVTTQQAQGAYDSTQQGLAQQLAFLQAIQGQNGIQNQSNVFNQLQGVANGTGPNPAQAMLNNATGQNVAQQAAMMAGQRGASANTGLIARQAAMQGANVQQQAVGQGAALQANQGLNALNQMSNIAGQQVSNQGQAVQGFNNAAQGQQANLLTGIGQQNNAAVGMQSNMNTAQSNVAGKNADAQNKLAGGFISGPGALLGLAKGGEVKGPRSKVAMHLSNGGPVNQGQDTVPALLSPGEKYLSPQEAQQVARGQVNPAQAGKVIPGTPQVKGDSPKNDKIPADLKEGGVVIPRSVMNSDDPVKHTIAFVRAHLSQQAKKKAA